jgi:phage terminase large subunit
VEQLLGHGIRARAVPSLGVQDGIQATRLLLRTARFSKALDHGPRSPIEALRQYQYEYDEAKQTFRAKPRHDWASDYCDGLRIGALGYKEDYGTAPPFVPEKYKTKPLVTEGMQLNKLWDTAKRPVGRWGRRI